MKKLWVFLISALTLLGCGNQTQIIIGDDPLLFQVTFNETLQESGYVTVPIVGTMQSIQFANVVIDLNGDGIWQAYQVNGNTQEEWVAQNIPISPIGGVEYSYSFLLMDPNLATRSNFETRVVISSGTIDDSPLPLGWDGMIPANSVDSKDFEISAVSTDNQALLRSDATDVAGTTGLPVQAQVLEGETSVQVEGVPNTTQSHNECVPTATANALQWLANEYGFSDMIPESTSDLIDELKGDFNWTATNGVIVASDVDGPIADNYLAGKNTFTERHGIPIETHQLGGNFDRDVVELIAAELEKGQIVEIDMEYDQANLDDDGNFVPGQRTGGHMVTVVGASSIGTRNFLDFHDPLNPRQSRDTYRIVEDENGARVSNYRYQGGLNLTRIRFAIAESPIESNEPKATFELNEESIMFEHQVGMSPCPQEIAVLEITNTTDEVADYTLSSSNPAISFSVENVGAAPGEKPIVRVFFTCMPPQSVDAEITITGQLVGTFAELIPGSEFSRTIPVKGTVSF